MKQSTKDRAQGAMHEAKGKIKEKVGEMRCDDDQADEGTAEKLGGKIQKVVGKIEKKLGA